MDLPKKFNRVTRQDVRTKYLGQQLLIAGGNGAAAVSFIRRFFNQSENANRIRSALLQLYAHFAKNFRGYGADPELPVDIFLIENAALAVAHPIHVELEEIIRHRASARISRKFLPSRKKESRFNYEVKRFSGENNFGKGNVTVIFIDPTVATGESIFTAIKHMRQRKIKIPYKKILIWTLVAAPMGIERLCKKGATVITGLVSDGLDSRAYNVISCGLDYAHFPGDIETLLSADYHPPSQLS